MVGGVLSDGGGGGVESWQCLDLYNISRVLSGGGGPGYGSPKIKLCCLHFCE